MSNGKPFDGARFVMFLLAFVIVCEMVMLGAFVGSCIYWSELIVKGQYKCDPENRIGEVFSLVLATIIAMLGGRTPGMPPYAEKPPPPVVLVSPEQLPPTPTPTPKLPTSTPPR
jgi:hypothetical protein